MRDMETATNPGGRIDLPDKRTDEEWRAVRPAEHARRLLALGVSLSSLPPYVRASITPLSGDGAIGARADNAV